MATRVLVADDEAHIRWVVVRMLAAAGYDVEAARDGAEALELARQVPPDVLVTDLNMPRLDGLSLCRALAADPATAGVRVVVITCRDVRPGDPELDLPSVRHVITKPFSPRRLVQAVNELTRPAPAGPPVPLLAAPAVPLAELFEQLSAQARSGPSGLAAEFTPPAASQGPPRPRTAAPPPRRP